MTINNPLADFNICLSAVSFTATRQSLVCLADCSEVFFFMARDVNVFAGVEWRNGEIGTGLAPKIVSG